MVAMHDVSGERQKIMKNEQLHFLTLLEIGPARLTVEQVAWILNCQAHDVPVLVSTKLLKPIGNPPENGVKYFNTAEVLEVSRNPTWLARMTNAIHQHWHRKNANRKRPDSEEANGHGCPPSSRLATA